jgi:hypothetical protein
MKRNLLTITLVDNIFYFDILCINQQKQLQVEFRLNYLLDRANNILNKYLQTLARNIRHDLIYKDYNKYPIIVNLNLNGIFIENIEVPRLSKRETKRALHLELAKLYGNFDSKFIYSVLKFPYGKQFNLQVALFDLEIYRNILFFLNETRLKIQSITLAPNNFKNLLLDNKMIYRPENANIVINIGKNYTTIIGVRGKEVIAHHIINHGYKTFEDKFIDLLKSSSDEEAPSLNLKKEMNRELFPIIEEVNRISGALITESEVEIYLYVEDEIEDRLINAMAFCFEIPINKLLAQPYLKEILEMSVLVKVDRTHDFIFPTRISDEKEN